MGRRVDENGFLEDESIDDVEVSKCTGASVSRRAERLEIAAKFQAALVGALGGRGTEAVKAGAELCASAALAHADALLAAVDKKAEDE